MNDIDQEIRRLTKTIHELMSRSETGWVSWKQVARHHTGSADGADLLSSLAGLSQCRYLFATTHSKVKLTKEGLGLARSAESDQATLLGKIADAVVRYARTLRPIVLAIQNVSVIERAGSKIVHAIEVELSDEVLPTETPVQVNCLNSRPVPGKLVGQEPDGDVLYVACDTDVSPDQQPTNLVIDRSYLLTQLADQVRRLPALPHHLLSIFETPPGSVIADTDSVVVADRLARLQPPWTRFLWGPPGAGKTFGLGHLVAQLLKTNPGETVLIVAPSNRAVDVAVRHLVTRFAANSIDRLIRERRVLRFGYPRNTAVLDVPELLGPANLDELNKRVQQIARKIAVAEQEKGKSSDVAVLRAKLLAAQEAIKEAVREHVAQCSVVATTTTLAYMPNSPVAARTWDTVIVDEVTMVPTAICAYLASRTKRRLLLAGDPCQLGPVFEDRGGTTDVDTAVWLKNDVFTTSGVSSGKLAPNAIGVTDGRLVRITAQRRCAAGIWSRISDLYPQVESILIVNRLRTLEALSPAPGDSVAVFDLSREGAKCERRNRSWQNVVSAKISLRIAATIASQAIGNLRVAIITPYRAQVKILRQLIREVQRSSESYFGQATVEAGTVHQFQGSEADAVVFDLVDGPGRHQLGLLLRGDTGTRLVNVAISRAKGKLIVVADQEWCRSADLATHNHLLSQLVLGNVR